MADPGKHPGYVLLRDGECCDGKIYPDLGMTAELAAWWQRNKAAAGEVISVGAITALAIPVETLRTMFPVRGKLSRGWSGREDWADPGERLNAAQDTPQRRAGAARRRRSPLLGRCPAGR